MVRACQNQTQNQNRSRRRHFHPPQEQNVSPNANAIAMLQSFYQLYCLDALVSHERILLKIPLNRDRYCHNHIEMPPFFEAKG